LWGAAIENGFSGQTWLTFKQAKALGGSVMKGERGSMVFYADKFIPKDEQERAVKEGDEAAFVPFLKRYTVFNAAQCEGLPPELTTDAKPLTKPRWRSHLVRLLPQSERQVARSLGPALSLREPQPERRLSALYAGR